jgi:hypothetical protein
VVELNGQRLYHRKEHCLALLLVPEHTYHVLQQAAHKRWGCEKKKKCSCVQINILEVNPSLIHTYTYIHKAFHYHHQKL